MINKILSRWLLFPILYGINSVLYFFFSYHREASTGGLLSSALFTISIIVIVCGLSFLTLRDLPKAATFTFVFAILFFNFQNFIFHLRKISANLTNNSLLRFWHSNLGQNIVFCIIFLLLMIVLVMIKNSNFFNPRLVIFLNIISISFLLFTGFNGVLLVSQHRTEKKRFEIYWENQLSNNTFELNINNLERPDIYYIILDGFTRSDILQDLYELDNSKFVRALEDRGFYVASQSYSNYTQTRSSLASSLNLMYLNGVADFVGENKSNYYPAYHMIDNSILERTLRSIDYELVSFFSGISYSEHNDWDIYYKPKYIPDSFSQTFLSTTAFSVFINPQLYQWHYDTITYTTETLPTTTVLEGPQFIFAHIMCPHPPFIFERNGTLKQADRLFTKQDANYFLSSGTPEEYKNGYKDQVIFIQNSIIESIDRIMDNAKEPLIIIIQGDHGSGLQVDLGNLSNTNIKERLAILNAIYYYDQNYNDLYPEISPVNTFRSIFTNYFNTFKPILKDTHYFSEYWTLFNFTQVDALLD